MSDSPQDQGQDYDQASQDTTSAPKGPPPTPAQAVFSVAQYLGSVTRVSEFLRVLEDLSDGLKQNGAPNAATIQAQLETLQQMHRQFATRQQEADSSSSNDKISFKRVKTPDSDSQAGQTQTLNAGFEFHNGNQGSGASIADQIGHLHRNTTGLYADVHFMVGGADTEADTDKDKIVPIGGSASGPELVSAHKLILGLMSPVFGSMFFSAMDSHVKITVPDSTPAAFKTMLGFIYCGGWSFGHRDVTSVLDGLTLEELKNVYYLARKYCLVGLESICIIAFCSFLSSTRVFDLLSLARFYDLELLEVFCWTFMEQNTVLVLDANMDSIDETMMTEILSRHTLGTNEVGLLELLMNWGRAQCTKMELDPETDLRGVIEFGLGLIRFPTMTGNDFADAVPSTGLLTTEQIASILIYINASEEKKPDMTEFSTVARRTPRCWRFLSREITNQLMPMVRFYNNFMIPNFDEYETTEEIGYTPPRRTSRASRRAAARRARGLAISN